jgi:hypothetical protein
MEVLLLLILPLMGAVNVACFIVGAKVGQAASRGETIETPQLNPMKAYQEKQNRRAAEEEQSRIDTIMQNIESYDGTPNGQKDVPR